MRVFRFCFGNGNSVSKLRGLRTLMLLPAVYFYCSKEYFHVFQIDRQVGRNIKYFALDRSSSRERRVLCQHLKRPSATALKHTHHKCQYFETHKSISQTIKNDDCAAMTRAAQYRSVSKGEDTRSSR